MFVLLEKINPFNRVYEYDVFEEDLEINYSNLLFSIKLYYLESTYSRIKNEIDLFIFDNNYFSKNIDKMDILIEALKKEVIKEFCELNVDENTKINIKRVED